MDRGLEEMSVAVERRSPGSRRWIRTRGEHRGRFCLVRSADARPACWLQLLCLLLWCWITVVRQRLCMELHVEEVGHKRVEVKDSGLLIQRV